MSRRIGMFPAVLAAAMILVTPMAANAATVPASSSTSSDVTEPSGGAPVSRIGGCTTPIVTISNVVDKGTTIKYPTGADWQVAGSGPVHLTLQKETSVSNSFTGSVAPTPASVGFDVSKSTGTTISGSVDVPSGQRWLLRAGQVFNVKSYTWRKASNCGTATTGTGTALNFRYLNYSHLVL